jgi:hypothetical protein
MTNTSKWSKSRTLDSTNIDENVKQKGLPFIAFSEMQNGTSTLKGSWVIS